MGESNILVSSLGIGLVAIQRLFFLYSAIGRQRSIAVFLD